MSAAEIADGSAQKAQPLPGDGGPAERIVSQMASSTTPLSDDDLDQLCAVLWESTDSNTTSMQAWLRLASSSGSQALAAAVCQFAFGAWMRTMLLLLSQRPELGSSTKLDDMQKWMDDHGGLLSAHDNLSPSPIFMSVLLKCTAPLAANNNYPGRTVAQVVELGATWAASHGLWVVLEGLGLGLRDTPTASTPAAAAVNAAAASLGVTCCGASALRQTTHESILKHDAYALIGWLDGSHLVPGGPSTQQAAQSAVGPRTQWRPLQCGPRGATACCGSDTHPLAELMTHMESFDVSESWMPAGGGGSMSKQLVQLLMCCPLPSAAQWATQRIIMPALQDGGSQHAGAVITRGGLVMPLCAVGELQLAQQAMGQAGGEGPDQVQLGTALMLAAYSGHADCVRWLVEEQGVPVDTFVAEERLVTALHAAAFAGHVGVIDVLLAAGASTALVFDEYGECRNPAMHCACAGGHIAAVRRLWEAGATAQSDQPQQHLDIPHAITCAMQSGSPEVIQFVVDNCGPSDHEVRHAAVECCWLGKSAHPLRVLYSMGHAPSSVQNACVMRTCQYGTAAMLRELLQLGFDFSMVGAIGQVASGSATDSAEKLELLQSHGGWLSLDDVGKGRASILYPMACLMNLPSPLLGMVQRTGRCKDFGDGTSITSMAGHQSRSTGMSVPVGRSFTSGYQRMLVAGADPKAVDGDDRGAMTQLLMSMGGQREDPVEVRNLVSFGMDTQKGRGRTWPRHLTVTADRRLKELYLE